ncbi:MAG: PEP-CTERM sorting domain-containing protein [Proteobacteria bacterium]|nr:PEP-CTERM sorting domain-containing protein [Pseudomonadota bacterium]
MRKPWLQATLIAAALSAPLWAHAGDAGALPPPTPAPDAPANTVPEPGSVALAGMAGLALIALRRRRTAAVPTIRATRKD